MFPKVRKLKSGAYKVLFSEEQLKQISYFAKLWKYSESKVVRRLIDVDLLEEP